MKSFKIFAFCIASVALAVSCSNHGAQKKVNASVTHSFSSLNAVDTFKIELNGKKSADMVLHFTITDSKGQQIYNVELKGKEIIENTDPNLDLSTEKAQVKFLKTITDDFFGEDDFLEPAVMPEDVADNNVPDPAFYEALKKTGLNGFKYRLGKEKNIYIAWDEKEQKVKVYYNCC